jgi:hypothetical protein
LTVGEALPVSAGSSTANQEAWCGIGCGTHAQSLPDQKSDCRHGPSTDQPATGIARFPGFGLRLLATDFAFLFQTSKEGSS